MMDKGALSRLALADRHHNIPKKIIVFLHDLAWVPPALFLGYWVRFNLESIPGEFHATLAQLILLAVPLQALLFWKFGLYRGIWRFASIPDLMRILKAVGLGTVLLAGLVFVLRLGPIPRSIIFLYPIWLSIGLCTPRLIYRWVKDNRLGLRQHPGRRTLVVGAGKAADLLIRDLIKNDPYQPVGILDDAPAKWGQELHGVRVLGGVDQIEGWIQKLDVEVVLVAVASVPAKLMRRIVRECSKAKVECVTLPSLLELANGQVSVSRLRPVHLEDLLGRPEIRIDDARVRTLLNGRRVLVTGAGGSIGSELVRQVADFAPSRLILLDHSEFNLYSIDHELSLRKKRPGFVSLLGDVRDEARMRAIFQKHRPEIVFHAAALKHVPLIETNAREAVRTNVFGTKVMADLAMESGVERFVLVSTDKAVNPTNVMGATKRAAERYCQSLCGASKTAFITTRFGNVLGSAGSVVPLFRRQIKQGGPVTVTHPEITRYFMTIPEAVSLILQATAMGEGDEIFVLDMGEPVKIVDLAREMIRLCGFEPDRDIEIRFVGLRPGEKLHEELFHAGEALTGTSHPKIMRAGVRESRHGQLLRELETLKAALRSEDEAAIVRELGGVVPEFRAGAMQGSGDRTAPATHAQGRCAASGPPVMQ